MWLSRKKMDREREIYRKGMHFIEEENMTVVQLYDTWVPASVPHVPPSSTKFCYMLKIQEDPKSIRFYVPFSDGMTMQWKWVYHKRVNLENR